MNFLCDLDFILKLHASNVLEDFKKLFSDDDKHNFFMVDHFVYTAKSRAKKLQKENNPMYKIFDDIANENLPIVFNKISQSRPDEKEIDIFDELIKISNIDAGEAVLLVNSFEMSNSIIFTGDKRFIEALGKNMDKIIKLYPKTSIQIVYFLDVVYEICKKDIQNISKFSSPLAVQDKALQAIFGGQPTLENIQEAVTSYTNTIREFCYKDFLSTQQ